jgi:acyl-CoA reductase-like NAD-dependent aldehyde dehydrogenase
MSDVDVDAVSKNITAKKTGNAGQTCVCYNRIYTTQASTAPSAKRSRNI